MGIPESTTLVADRIESLAGWKAYRVRVPGKASVFLRLRAEHEAWFRLTTTSSWGRMEEGMLQNRIYHGKPEASYINPKDTSPKKRSRHPCVHLEVGEIESS